MSYTRREMSFTTHIVSHKRSVDATGEDIEDSAFGDNMANNTSRYYLLASHSARAPPCSFFSAFNQEPRYGWDIHAYLFVHSPGASRPGADHETKATVKQLSSDI